MSVSTTMPSPDSSSPAAAAPDTERCYDLFSPAFIADPYPVFDQLREHDPVYWYEQGRLGRWIVTRYADVRGTLRNPRWSADRVANMMKARSATLNAELLPLYRAVSDQMLFSDPPDHPRLRNLAGQTFTPRVVEQVRPRLEQLVAALLDKVAPAGGMDAVGDFAFPLPATVILEILGLPPERREQFKAWSVDFAAFLGNVHCVEDVDRRASRSVLTALDYFHSLVPELRAHPRDDLLSALVLAEEEGHRLSVEELLANAMLLLLGGHETTTNLIGNGLLALLRNPEQMQRLRADPTLLPAATEEFLRYESPIQYTGRTAPCDVAIGGRRIAEGDSVLFFLGAANRDRQQFEQADRLDVGRRDNRHLGFGHGSHFCLGASLARLEGQAAIGTLLRRFPRLHLATDTVEWQPNFAFRGLQALPVAW